MKGKCTQHFEFVEATDVISFLLKSKKRKGKAKHIGTGNILFDFYQKNICLKSP